MTSETHDTDTDEPSGTDSVDAPEGVRADSHESAGGAHGGVGVDSPEGDAATDHSPAERPLDEDELPTAEELANADDRVRRLEEDRFVVATDDEPAAAASDAEPSSPEPTPQSERTPPSDDGSSAGGTEPAARLASRPEPFGAYLCLKNDESVDEFVDLSTDVRDPFEGLLRWYARQVQPERDPDEVLSVLLATSDLDLDLDR